MHYLFERSASTPILQFSSFYIFSLFPTVSLFSIHQNKRRLKEQGENKWDSGKRRTEGVRKRRRVELKMFGCLSGAKVRCWLTLASGLLECLCFAGAVFGWASLMFVLKAEGYFSNLCVNATGPNGTQYTGEFNRIPPHFCKIPWFINCIMYIIFKVLFNKRAEVQYEKCKINNI